MEKKKKNLFSFPQLNKQSRPNNNNTRKDDINNIIQRVVNYLSLQQLDQDRQKPQIRQMECIKLQKIKVQSYFLPKIISNRIHLNMPRLFKIKNCFF